MLQEIIKQNRSYRKFDENYEIKKNVLLKFIDAARFAPSARNQQILMFKPIVDKELREKIFPHLKWAAYLKDWNGPEKGQRPTAYIIIGFNKNHVKFEDNWRYTDLGLAIQTILLLAVEKGLGGCNIAAFNKKEIKELIDAPDFIDLQIVLVLGKSAQNIKIVPIDNNNNIEYFEKENIHFVPKRTLDAILF